MKNRLLLGSSSLVFFCLVGCSANQISYAQTNDNNRQFTDAQPSEQTHKWDHGSEFCDTQTDSSFDRLSVDDATHIFRQNKCDTFEAPFLYLLAGTQRSLLLDSGAIESALKSSVIDVIKPFVAIDDKQFIRPLIVAHSHSHLDHVAGDAQFSEFNNVSIVEPSRSGVIEFFNLIDWPSKVAYFELGDRNLVIIPTPGHHADAISIYDPKTKFLLTGDTLYPGQIYVRNWDDYRDSIIRLSEFAEKNEVAAILGTHIEMSDQPTVMYPIGTTYQPNETNLMITPQELKQLASSIKTKSKSTELIFDRFTITPMSFVQKALSSVISVFY